MSLLMCAAATDPASRPGSNKVQPADIDPDPVAKESEQLEVGAGVIVQTSPYRASHELIVFPIPAILYGDMVQILGPSAEFGIMSLGNVALAVTASYRPEAYDEDDSPFLEGLGDRHDTLMGGAAILVQLPMGFDLSAGYEHDLLHRIDAGCGSMELEKSFRNGPLTVTPDVTLCWFTPALAQYEFGVPADKVREGRPAYRPGSAATLECGVTVFLDLQSSWRIMFNGNVTFLPGEFTASPIVDESCLFGGFIAITRLF
jgi:outer membrane protein